MTKYIVQRIFESIPVLWGISVLSFFLIRLVPGDTVTAMLGTGYTPAAAAVLRTRYGLNKPLVVQYLIWLNHIVHGQFGTSAYSGRPVLTTILHRLPVTVELTVISILFAVVVAIPLGILSAIHRASVVDHTVTLFGLLGLSVPGFWLGIMLILLFSWVLGWLPSGGFVSLWAHPLQNLMDMVMPGISLGTAVSAVVMRMTRSSILEVVQQEYVKMARAKGVPNRRVVFLHTLKNAMVPIVTVLGIQTGYLLGGSVVIEQIFSLPGIGQLAFQAITNRDYTVLQGDVLFIASAFVLVNLIVDILYAYLNPTIRY